MRSPQSSRSLEPDACSIGVATLGYPAPEDWCSFEDQFPGDPPERCDLPPTYLDDESGLPWCDRHGPHSNEPYHWWE